MPCAALECSEILSTAAAAFLTDPQRDDIVRSLYVEDDPILTAGRKVPIYIAVRQTDDLSPAQRGEPERRNLTGEHELATRPLREQIAQHKADHTPGIRVAPDCSNDRVTGHSTRRDF
jgi:hypothetical protein